MVLGGLKDRISLTVECLVLTHNNQVGVLHNEPGGVAVEFKCLPVKNLPAPTLNIQHLFIVQF